jgi:hypothetical protein
MKKMILVLCLLPFACVYSQTGDDSDCNSNVKNIFKVFDLKIRYEAVEYIYEKHGFLSIMSKPSWNHYFRLVRGYPLDTVEQKIFRVPVKFPVSMEDKDTMIEYTLEEMTDSIPNEKQGKLVKAEWVPVTRLSEEEVDKYIEQLNCTPEQALHEYLDFIWKMKSEKQMYLNCLEAELAKGDSSEYAKVRTSYHFHPVEVSVLPPPTSLSKLDCLKVFKEFIFNDNKEVLPDGIIAYDYLKGNCKIP